MCYIHNRPIFVIVFYKHNLGGNSDGGKFNQRRACIGIAVAVPTCPITAPNARMDLCSLQKAFENHTRKNYD